MSTPDVDDNPYEADTPTHIKCEVRFKFISSRESTYGIDVNDKLWSWGQNWNGNLGHGDYETRGYKVMVLLSILTKLV